MENWDEIVVTILNKMSSRRDAEDFLTPVRWREFQLDDYPTIVKNPMDIGTVLGKIKNGIYKSQEECVADIRLIWCNSMLYNIPGSKIYAIAKSLSEHWESQWALYVNDENRPPSSEEMTTWIEDCYRLPSLSLGEVIIKLNELCPQCLVKKNGTIEIEVNVDLIPGLIFRELSNVVGSLAPEVNRREMRLKSRTLK